MFRRNTHAFLLAALVLCRALPAHPATRPNIVLITMDSTRADRMGFLGSKAKLTPNLDGVAGQSMVFEQSYAQAPLTVVSHATILSGTYPQTHQASELGSRLATDLPFLPDLLHARGYHTAAFVGSICLDPKNGFAPGFDRGFDVYDAGFHPPGWAPGGVSSIVRPAAQVVARAAAWLARNRQGPFFLWVQLNDPQSASDANYNAAVAAADGAAGKLIATLRSARLYDEALIVIASDHGESLGAHGEQTHGVFLYDETVRVPLLAKLPNNQNAGKRVRARASLVDTAPTILEITGVPIPSRMQGQSLLRIARSAPDSDQPAYSVTELPREDFGWSALESWRAGKYLYVKAPQPELYDLASDPGAAHNLAPGAKATLGTMAAQLEGFDRRFSSSGSAASSSLSSSEMQKLSSLGYVGLQKPVSRPTAPAKGVDPKDGIATANQVLSAARWLERGKPEMAAEVLDPVMTGASKMYLAHYVLGAALGRQGKYPQAIEQLRQAIVLQPDSSWAHYEMGACLLKSGDHKTAVIHLEIASRRLPDFAPASAMLAETYDRLNRSDDARRERSRAVH
jgi:arylsulfatase A-like enzyme